MFDSYLYFFLSLLFYFSSCCVEIFFYNQVKSVYKTPDHKYGKAVDYSSLLSERGNLMKPYFEPNEEEAQSHLKEPTKARRAIAQLTKNDYLEIIFTTNFDRPLEKALADEGITLRLSVMKMTSKERAFGT